MTLFPIQTIDDDVLVVDSRIIADGLGVDHHNFMQTIRKHQAVIEQDFGKLLFQTEVENKAKFSPNPQKFALLTESQFLFIAALSKNTPQAVKVKSQLVQSFVKARDALQSQQRTLLPQVEDSQDYLLDASIDPTARACMSGVIGKFSNVKSRSDIKNVLQSGLDFLSNQESLEQEREVLNRKQKELDEREIGLIYDFCFDDSIPKLSPQKNKDTKLLDSAETTDISDVVKNHIVGAERRTRGNQDEYCRIPQNDIISRLASVGRTASTDQIASIMTVEGYTQLKVRKNLVWVKPMN